MVGLLALAAIALVLPQALALPTFSRQGLATPTVLIVSWFGALLAAQAGFEPAWDLYATEGTRTRVLNLTRILLVGAAAALISWLALGNAAMSLTSLASMLGVALVSAATLGHRLAWIAPTAYLLVIVGAGAVDPVGSPRLWATPGNPSPGEPAFALATALLVLGLCSWLASSRRQSQLDTRD